MPISIDAMRDKLLTVEQVQDRLQASEPLEPHAFPVNSNFRIFIPDDWHTVAGDQVVKDAAICPSGETTYALTKDAILEAGAHGGIPREHQQQIPAAFLQQEIAWWFTEGLGDKQFKLLKNSSGTVLGITRATINPFSNMALLSTILGGIASKYGAGTEVLADYKFHHDLELTALRLIVPERARAITGTRVENDTWSVGINFRNSLIGLKPPELSGYLFSYWCTNGSYDTMSRVTAGRRAIKTEGEAIEWAAEAVDSILGGLEPALDGIQELTGIPVTGDASLVLGDLFTQHNVPRRERLRVMANMADLGGELTMYDVMQATTQAANLDGLSPRSVDILMNTGGHVAHAYTSRCDGSLEHGCRRLLPEGYLVPGS